MIPLQLEINDGRMEALIVPEDPCVRNDWEIEMRAQIEDHLRWFHLFNPQKCPAICQTNEGLRGRRRGRTLTKKIRMRFGVFCFSLFRLASTTKKHPQRVDGFLMIFLFSLLKERDIDTLVFYEKEKWKKWAFESTNNAMHCSIEKRVPIITDLASL